MPEINHANSTESPPWYDFLLKPELIRALDDFHFEAPLELQQKCMPKLIMGNDIICQAGPGLGKTTALILTILQQVEPVEKNLILVLCHNSASAFKMGKEHGRFITYMPEIKIAVFCEQTPVQKNIETLKNASTYPHIIIATPERLKVLVGKKNLYLESCKVLVLYECDKMVEGNMRSNVQDIFHATLPAKQVMVFSATLSQETKQFSDKLTQCPFIYIDDEAKVGHLSTKCRGIFFTLLSWDNAKASSSAYISIVFFIIAIQYFNILRYAFDAILVVSYFIVLMELIGEICNHSFMARLRPRRYYVISRETFDSITNDLYELLNYIVLKLQYIIFIERITVSSTAVLIIHISFSLLKSVQLWGFILIYTTIVFFTPLMYKKLLPPTAPEKDFRG